MRINIRSKLIIAISLLMVIVFSFAAFLFINEKKDEMADDIYLNSLAFARLTASEVIRNYELYLEQGGFVYFNREIKSLFEQNDDIAAIKVVSYSGKLLYDSFQDVDKKYAGDVRKVDDELLKFVQSEYVGIKVRNEALNTAFLKFDPDENYEYVDYYGNLIPPFTRGVLVDYFVIPASEKHSVVFEIDYHNLDERVDLMMRRIIYLAIFGILLGMMLSFVMSSRITNSVAKLVVGARNIAKGDFKTRVDIETNDEIGFLGNAFNGMAQDLEASIEVKLYKERVTHELELATQIQNQIIPDDDEIPKCEGIEIAVGLISAEEIGGDMYDFIKVEDGRLFMYLGDVTGHGVPAGIVSSIASALFYGLSGYADLKKIIINVNRVMKVKTMSNMFMTLCLMEWNPGSGDFSYVSAGHEQLIHYISSSSRVELTPAGGVALGMIPDISNHVGVEFVNFQKGDFLIVYSDGIPEAWRNENENYGMERLKKAINEAGKVCKTSEEMKQAILKDVENFRAGYKQMDDITLVVLKRV